MTPPTTSSSRPASPFKRLSRPSSRNLNTRDPSPSRSAWRSSRLGVPGGAGGMDDRQHGGPSMSSWDTTRNTAAPLSALCLTRAEHYDVVLEGSTSDHAAVAVAATAADMAGTPSQAIAASEILPHLGFLVLDQAGTIDEADPHRSSFDDDRIMPRSGSGSSINAIRSPQMDVAYSPALGSAPSENRFESMLQELLYTEKSYVKRIETLYRKYAVPLRQMARDRESAIIPLYEAQRLFGNIGELVGANTAFLRDLETYVESREHEHELSGRLSTGNLGDVIYRNMACFSCYSEYFGNFEKAKHIEQTMSRTNKSFRDFVDRIKYSTPDMGNIGIRELIMEPIQRIPRYTLLLDGLVRNLPKADINRPRLEEAAVLAGRIASCEVDDKTKRAAVLWSFKRNVEGFPSSLISVHRQFIDCIDVDDFPFDGAVLGPSTPASMSTSPSPGMLSPGGGGGQHAYRTIHCTLFLFDDVIAIAKRTSSGSNGRTGRSAVGLDDLNKLADQMKTFTERSGGPGGVSSISSKDAGKPSKIELGFRGCIDIGQVQALDLGGPDFQLTMASGPSNVTGDKWAGRLVRQYAATETLPNSTYGGHHHHHHQADPGQARQEKYRFLENVWRAQALLKTRDAKSHVRCLVLPPSANNSSSGSGSGSGMETEERAKRIIYWNVYQKRSLYLTDPSKSFAVLHVDPAREADRIPLGAEHLPPSVCMRIRHIDSDGGTLAYTSSIKGPNGPEEEDTEEADSVDERTLPLCDISSQLRKLSNEARSAWSDFDPRMDHLRVPGDRGSPTTPSSHRGRRVVSGLEQFGRSLFSTYAQGSLRSNSGAGSSDVFGVGSPHRRTKSTASKASAATTNTTNSSTPSRTASTGARTYSTANTSIGSRNGLLAQSTYSQSPAAEADQSTTRKAVEAYRKRALSIDAVEAATASAANAPEEHDIAMERTPTRNSSQASRQRTQSTPVHANRSPGMAMQVEGRTSPIRRKPVPAASTYDDNEKDEEKGAAPDSPPLRVEDLRRNGSAASSKRALPLDATPRRGSAKRAARTDEEEEVFYSPASLSPSPTPNRRRSSMRSPIGPRAVSPSPFAASTRTPLAARTTDAAANGGKDLSSGGDLKPTRPLSVRKDGGQGRMSIGGGAAKAQSAATKAQIKKHLDISQQMTARLDENLMALRDELVELDNDSLGRRLETVHASVRLVAEQGDEALRGLERIITEQDSTPSTNGDDKGKLLELTKEVERLKARVKEGDTAKTEVASLTRRCEVLTALEKDGRLENTELHRAFNEELDRMYGDAHVGFSGKDDGGQAEMVRRLREEVKSSKAERNAAQVENKALQRDLALEKAQADVYKALLEQHGLA